MLASCEEYHLLDAILKWKWNITHPSVYICMLLPPPARIISADMIYKKVILSAARNIVLNSCELKHFYDLLISFNLFQIF